MPKPTAKPETDDIDAALDGIDDAVESELRTVDRRLSQMDKESPLDSLKKGKNLEEDDANEVSATLAAFQANRAAERQLVQDTTDSEYWFCVCFQTREQKEAFLKAVKWFGHGDKYLDGAFVAKQMGVALPPSSVRFVEIEQHKRIVKELPAIETAKKVTR
jgi:hypothetical protein